MLVMKRLKRILKLRNVRQNKCHKVKKNLIKKLLISQRPAIVQLSAQLRRRKFSKSASMRNFSNLFKIRVITQSERCLSSLCNQEYYKPNF
ncbi:hypothetical protein FGO68_gene13730 [Halteria grandinella]|uniref:Uncharacterized protein n=1 Tax=Halteria grandinella TaxID=5974 RepID=A0A8J8NW98_HALGN|nr:hypothetical protein FGO68_gene13730 [Halteria grandinella]